MLKKRGVPKEYGNFFTQHRRAIAVTTLMGTIIGAGILGIPYVVAKSGFLLGFIIILLIGLACLTLNLFYGEVILRTKTQHQLPGYAQKYFGKWGKLIAGISIMFGIYGALSAYLIGEGMTIYTILGFGSPLLFSLIFFTIASTIIYFGIKATGKAELFLIALLVLVVILIGTFSFKAIKLENLTTFNLGQIFVPYGVILFAFLGLAAIPEMQEELAKEKKKMKLAILIGSIVPIVIYLLFTVVVLGIIGWENFELLKPNERIATVALSMYSQPILGIFANLMALFAMLTSFLALGTALVEVYALDYKLNRKLALFLTLILPLLIVVFNLSTFIIILGITGAFYGGIEGILVVLMFWKAKKMGNRKPEYSLRKHYLLGGLLILMFILGMLYQFF